MRRMGKYPNQETAKNDAQVLADTAARGVKVYVQPISAKKTEYVSKRMAAYRKRRRNAGSAGLSFSFDSTGGEHGGTVTFRRGPVGKVGSIAVSVAPRTTLSTPICMKDAPNWVLMRDYINVVRTQGGGGEVPYATKVKVWKAAQKALEDFTGLPPTRRALPKRRNSNWIQGVDREIEARGTEGAFTAQARRAGYSDAMQFARKVMAGWRSGKKTVYNKKTRRQQRITEKSMDRANFAINLPEAAKQRCLSGRLPR